MSIDPAMESSSSDLPFLVTHWLQNAAVNTNEQTPNDGSEEAKIAQQDAIYRVRKATRDLAGAFADLGMFGVTLNTPLGLGEGSAGGNTEVKSNSNLRNACYADVRRRWDGLGGRHLELLVGSSSSVSAAVLNDTTGPSSVVDLAYERENSSNNASVSQIMQQDVVVPSILQKPVQLLRAKETNNVNVDDISTSNTNSTQQNENKSIPSPVEAKLIVGSDFKRVECLAAQASKRYLSIRAKFQEEERAIRQIQRSLTYQKRIKAELETEATSLLSTHCASVGASAEVRDGQLSTSDNLAQKKLENERVIAQLGRRFDEFQNTHSGATQNELAMASSVVDALWKECVAMGSTYIDPSRSAASGFHISSKLHGQKSNSILSHVIGRGYGVGIKQRKGPLRQRIGTRTSEVSIRQRNKALLSRRLSHVVTINSHLFCPVYCLRFDRTGRFFVTGADDYLVKLFRIGSTVKGSSREKQKYDSRNAAFSHQRGAILVCTLRGHAGVITDIGVSADNALLATASEDGDVRVWGMTDGCPVAILRGHEGGANMVSWSSMTPFQLVSIAGDGLARMWDVREAALKRCKIIRNRVDYTLPIGDKLNNSDEEVNTAQQGNIMSNDDELSPTLTLTPTPNVENEEQVSSGNQPQQRNGEIYVPPLPRGAEFGLGAEAAAANNNNHAPGAVIGAFVANDEIDEGVMLLTRLLHGELPENSQFQGAGTRSRRKKVKVLCLSRCPIGGHFATGSDDGIGRIWLDDSNQAIEKLDQENRTDFDTHSWDGPSNIFQSQIRDSLQRTRSSSPGYNNAPSTRSLLASLHGHHNEITDIQYSRLGDRLITASQKDGVVRVWSWGNDTSKGLDGSSKIDHIKQIFIRLEPPQHLIEQRTNASSERTGSTSRRRQRNSSSQNSSLHTQCDVATWTADDTKIITSQSCVAKQTDTEIIPGSHLIFVWHSQSGNCLIGLPGAHEKPCPVLSSHPFDSSIIVSAGADGLVKIWDLHAGKCIFSHRNTHEYGALENLADRGKVSGYLDGSFSPDGLHLVLTDDTGRITMIDVLCPEELAENKISALSQRTNGTIVLDDDSAAPTWMQEQYFANDYYDLFYDASGYCIERGSRLPPHLSPEAARCMHTGHAYADSIQQAFAEIEGPIPLLEAIVSSERDSIHHKSALIRKQNGILARNVAGKRNLIEARATQASHIGNNLEGSSIARRDHRSSTSPVRRTVEATGSGRRNMSNRYRWIGFEEMERENNDDDDAETDDEEYEEGNRLRDDEPEEEHLDLDDYRPRAERRRNRNQSQRSRRRQSRNHVRRDVDELEEVIQNEPTRVSARHFSRRIDNQYAYESDESAFEEMLTANPSPTDHFKKDYTELGHIYKLPQGGSVNRKWVTREECELGYTGWKTYCPQEGDKIVYISKAHSETLRAFPVCETATGAPWKSWPKSAPWPIVVCTVNSIRYRFPYSGYYGSRSRNPISSIVAILTLELTDIPHTSHDRDVPWVSPDFFPIPSASSRNSTFEVAIFENGESDFIIPLELYKWRIQSLERTINENGIASGLELTDFYVNAETEDSKVNPFSCELLSTISHDENELHFQGSGYNSIHIKYDNDDDNLANSWDVTVKGTEKNCPLPTCLTDDQEKAAIEILDELESDVYVKATFSAPVNERSFVDYSMMIEVPMDISIIRRRLHKKYYTNILSVNADMKLVRDNCFKYNKMGSEITNEVNKLFETFISLFDKKLGSICNEACERERSEEVETAVIAITRLRRSSSLLRNSSNDASSGNNYNISVANEPAIAERSQRSHGPRQRQQDTGLNLNQELSSRSQRASRRLERGIDPEVPRIQINRRRRRQQEYISEEESDNHSESGNDSDEKSETEAETNAPKLKVLLGGEEYHSSAESDVESAHEETNNDTLRHNRSTRSQRHVSNSDDDSISVSEEPVRRSSRHSNGMASTRANVGEKSMNERQTRRSGNIENEEASSKDEFNDKSSSSEEEEDEVPVVPQQKNHRSTRSTTRSTASTPNQRPQSTRSSSSRRGQNQIQSLQEAFTRRISASTTRATRSRHFAPSVLESEVATGAGQRGLRSSRVPSSTLENLPPSSPDATRSSSRHKSNVSSYLDLSNSEFEDEESDSENESSPSMRRSRKKRSRPAPTKQTAASPKKRAKKEKRVAEVHYPQLDKWPGHIVKPNMMLEVCEGILDRVETFDAEQLFHIPVVEQHPDVAATYYEKVETPMDLRTIRTERMVEYRIISELQEDLILIFQNCCAFNRVKSQYWKYAVEIWENLNQIFLDTLSEKGLDLPRRFGR